MATGYVVTGRGDLDDLFAPRLSTAIANTNYRSNGGVDLAQRFESRGLTIAIANTGFRKGAADLASLFQGLGTIGAVLMTRTMVPGSRGSPSFDIAWENTASGYAGIAGASMSATPEWTKGGQTYRLDEVQKDGLSDFILLRISHATVEPLNSDNVWQFIRLTGTFSNSSGSVTRTLPRSIVPVTNDYTTPNGRPGLSWQIGSVLWNMIAGNSYTLELG